MEIFKTLAAILFSIGAFQGLVFGILLLTVNHQKNRLANGFLATLLFVLSYRLILQVFLLFGLGRYDVLYHLTPDLSWIQGPLLFFYVKALLKPGEPFRREDWLYFLPVLLQVCFSFFVRAQNFYWDGTRESLSWLGYWGYVIWMNYATIYIVASFLIVWYVSRAETLLVKSEPDQGSAVENLLQLKRILWSFKWYFTVVLGVLLVDLLVVHVVMGERYYYYFERFYYYPFFLGLSGLTYWLGLESFRQRRNHHSLSRVEFSATEKALYQETAERLLQLMSKEKLYLDPELSKAMLAERLSVKPYVVSHCLNEVLSKKYNDFVNELRVEEFKSLLRDGQNDQFTLLSLALQAGFNSKSSFNRAVRKCEGLTPRQLKERIRASTA